MIVLAVGGGGGGEVTATPAPKAVGGGGGTEPDSGGGEGIASVDEESAFLFNDVDSVLGDAVLVVAEDIGLTSLADNVSTLLYSLNRTMYFGFAFDPVTDVIFAG